jgi:hypothetical protein
VSRDSISALRTSPDPLPQSGSQPEAGLRPFTAPKPLSKIPSVVEGSAAEGRPASPRDAHRNHFINTFSQSFHSKAFPAAAKLSSKSLRANTYEQLRNYLNSLDFKSFIYRSYERFSCKSFRYRSYIIKGGGVGGSEFTDKVFQDLSHFPTTNPTRNSRHLIWSRRTKCIA